MVSGKSFPWGLSVSFLDTLCRCFLTSNMYQSHNSLCVCVSFLCIFLLRCEGEFYSHCLPKVPGTQWMHNACLFSEWMKTVKTMNEKHPESCIWWGTNNQPTTGWGWRFTGQEILIVVGESGSSGRGRLPALLLQPARTLRLWPGNTWLVQETLKDRSAFVWGYHTESYHLLPLVLRPLLDPIFMILSVIAPTPLCAQAVEFLFH